MQRAIRYTDEPNAPAMRVEPDLPPLRYAELRQKVKEKKPDIKFGKTFNTAMKKSRRIRNIVDQIILILKTKVVQRKIFIL